MLKVIGKLIIEIDSSFLVDTDYILLEPMGIKSKRRVTRPGVSEWIKGIKDQVGPGIFSNLNKFLGSN